MKPVIIAVDDEPYNLMLVENYLEESGYEISCFSGGAEALDYLRGGGAVDAVLLDRMMPGMDGMEFMRQFRALEAHAATPVVLQTAAARSAEIAEGIAAGAYYYLTKPYARDVLQAIVARALADQAFHRGMEQTAAQFGAAIHLMDTMKLTFRTLEDVRAVSFFLASLCREPQAAIRGITELMLNGVEHGNLGISYAEKGALIRAGAWEAEVERRLSQPEYQARRAQVEVQRTAGELILTFEDRGNGFDWLPYLGFDLQRVRDPHGRGIAMSRAVSFEEVTYIAPGNKVVCRVSAAAPP